MFFSIDPGYRGKSGKVSTQYVNLWEDNYDDDQQFYVPDNVYIIGTMNDIDRSVETMDFAFRRRFAFMEINASENLGMLDSLDNKDEAINHMERLNNAINEIGLNDAYHIGGAYFLKLKNYKNETKPFDCLWNNHLEPLLKEYLRGNAKAKGHLETLKKAYNG